SQARDAADANQFRGIESRAGESGHGGDGAPRRGVSLADDVAAGGIEGQDPRRLERPQAIRRSCVRMSLENDIAGLVAAGAAADRDAARDMFARLREAMSAGSVRAAEPDSSSPVG